jgi:hypothetical protein
VTLTRSQVESITAAMSLFVQDDLANGVPVNGRSYCGACASSRPAAGFIRYDGAEVCNTCAIEYEVLRASGRLRSIGAFIERSQGCAGA